MQSDLLPATSLSVSCRPDVWLQQWAALPTFSKGLHIRSRVALSRDVFYDASRLWAVKLRLFHQFRQVQPHRFWHALLCRIRAHGFESGTNLLDPKKRNMKQSFWVVFSVTGYIEIRWNRLQFQGTVLSCSCMWRQKGIWCNIGNINVKMWWIFVSRRMPRWLARMWALCGVWPTQTARSTDYQRSFRFSQKKMKRNQKNTKEQLNDWTHSKHHWRRSCASCSFV